MPLIRGKKRKIAAVVAGAAALPVLFAPSAWANWSSYIYGATIGFESRRWADESYTEVNFKGCKSEVNLAVGIEIYQDINNWPDDGYGEKQFTNCFIGKTSTGTESGLPSGAYYFEIKSIDGSYQPSANWVTATSVSVDTTLAD
ncbi:MAG TPA: hypothetical protein VK659_05130 [Asanoa sp.]|uniref:hypothetical protein n=1 Tax=Kribbella sp. TaxID=1871183 RepID=UPI002C83B554|nr:hypothetical protein [Kribbella sp.]HET6292875.1 hypothetical protein [Kribbella sp.]HTF07540.1 hypothetical protein [Asanoa sp.]